MRPVTKSDLWTGSVLSEQSCSTTKADTALRYLCMELNEASSRQLRQKTVT